jgi:hypothetical protein
VESNAQIVNRRSTHVLVIMWIKITQQIHEKCSIDQTITDQRARHAAHPLLTMTTTTMTKIAAMVLCLLLPLRQLLDGTILFPSCQLGSLFIIFTVQSLVEK